MEPYSRIAATRDQDDEFYYRTPTYDPEDIICPGSDEEETAEERRQKRQRYELQARRYLRGHRPVILSASLRGPFSKETGWVNPWIRPRTKRIQQGTKNGREAVISTRTGSQSLRSPYFKPDDMLVLRRQRGDVRESNQRKEKSINLSSSVEERSAPALGYLNPAEVLAWQARVGAVETAIAEDRLSVLGQIREYYEEGPLVMSPHARTKKAPKEAGSEARLADSMINHYVQTPHDSNYADFTTRASKRARDSEWLRGSYAYKRARWDGPALSSPSPAPDSNAGRGREQRHGSIRTAIPRNMIASTNRPISLTNGRRKPQVEEDHALFSAQIRDRMMYHSDTLGTGVSSVLMSDLPQQSLDDENIDELQEEHQALMSGSRTSSGRRPRKSSSNIRHSSIRDQDQDDLITIEPRPGSIRTPNPVTDNICTKVGSGHLPKLLSFDDDNISELGETSFVSEVAPSSRNLEQFHFKKRRPRNNSTKYDKLGEDDNSGAENEFMAADIMGTGRTRNEDNHSLPVSPSSVEEIRFDAVQNDATARNSRDVEYTIEVEDQEDVQEVEDPGDVEESEEVQKSQEQGRGQRTDVEAYTTQGGNTHISSCRPHSLLIPGVQPLSNNKEADESLDFGEMSFLRAVLRVADSANDTPYKELNTISKPEKSPLPQHETNQSSHRFDHPAKFNFETSKQTPSFSRRRASPTLLTSRRSQPSEGSSERDSQHSESLCISKHSPSVNNEFGPPDQTLTSNLPSNESRSPQGSDELDDPDCSNRPSISKDDPLPRSSTSAMHLTIPPALHLHAVKSSQDPNDISTQSYNTTPFKSQRSVRPPQSSKSIKLSTAEAHDNSLTSAKTTQNFEEAAKDRIQLELSQSCPSSDPQAHVPSQNHDDEFEQVDELDIEAEDSFPATEAIEQGKPVDGSDDLRVDNSGNGFGPQTVLPEANTVRTRPEQPATLSPDNAPEDQQTDLHTNVDDPKTNKPDAALSEASEDSEASWEGCGPQSPWAVEHIESILGPATELSHSAKPIDKSLLDEYGGLEEIQDANISLGWQSIERPHTPKLNSMKPFKELITPVEFPKPIELNSAEVLTDTQLLVDAATKNPWTSSFKKTTSTKESKRVSFGKLSTQDAENSQPISVRFGPVSPPPPTNQLQGDLSKNAITTTPKFEKHFNRQFRKNLPESVSSPENSSPALAAQAEAFIEADREILNERELRSTFNTPTKHLNPRSKTNSHTAWKQRDEADMLFPSHSRLADSPSPPVGMSLAAGFDMEEALGEAGNFLEDWSVDSELKRARGSNTSTANDNGYRRRRLFGLV